MEFKIGDVVELKSGGPPMTVSSIGDRGAVNTVWFTSTNTNAPSGPQHYTFNQAALKKAAAE